ncbi:MAG: hypothetical protein QF830_03105 [Rhodospirillales bacterium]|jgi:hypothetical protein|nr:hypothetical protein [Rhodospirillales bacterium]MDP6883101.1 hypothetical protein [Rhodospirillales bacterium]
MTGLWFVAAGLKAAAFVLALAAVLLVALQIGQRRDPGGPFHGWLDGVWRTVAATRWGDVARLAADRLLGVANKATAGGFEGADKGPILDTLFIGLMFVVLPGLALLNVVVGGRPNLALVYVAVFAVFAIFNFTAECRTLGPVNGAASLILCCTLYVFVPAYVLRAFADRLLHESVGHAFFESVLVAPLVFILAYAAMTFMERPGLGAGAPAPAGARTAAHAFLAALPVSFVLFFAALLAGHLAVAEANPARSWTLLVSAMAASATGFAVARALLAAGLGSTRSMALAWACLAGLVAAAGLSAALVVFAYGPAMAPPGPGEVLNVLAGRSRDGAGPYLGSEFWITHLPFLPMLAVLGAIGGAWLAKIVAFAVTRRPGAPFRPFTASGLYCAVLAVLAAVGAAWLEGKHIL